MTNLDTPSPQAPEFILQRLVESSEQSNAVLELGKKLVDELSLSDEVDTLGRWMAHYIAELIASVNSATAEERPDKLRRCATAIIDLWKHRYTLIDGKRPLEKFEPILRTLKSLDPNEDSCRYFSDSRSTTDVETDTEDGARWLKLARALDYAAKSLIRHCISQATALIPGHLRELVRVAHDAKLDKPDGPALWVLIANSDDLGKFDLNSFEQRRLEREIERLKEFEAQASLLVSDLERRLGDARRRKEPSQGDAE